MEIPLLSLFYFGMQFVVPHQSLTPVYRGQPRRPERGRELGGKGHGGGFGDVNQVRQGPPGRCSGRAVGSAAPVRLVAEQPGPGAPQDGPCPLIPREAPKPVISRR